MHESRARPRRSAALFLALALGLAPAAHADDAPRVRTGHAFAKQTGELLYTEIHLEQVDAGKVASVRVEYQTAAGALLAVKRVDFAAQPLQPDFELENLSTGHLEGATRRGETTRVVFRGSEADEVRRETLDVPPGAIVDAGFDRFIETHWDALVGGEAMVRPFLVPSRQAFVDFRIARDRELERGSTGVRVFVMQIASAWLRLVVPSIEVSYDAATRSLLRYRGLSNLRDAAGDNYTVVIDFPESASSSTQLAEPLLARADAQGQEPGTRAGR